MSICEGCNLCVDNDDCCLAHPRRMSENFMRGGVG